MHFDIKKLGRFEQIGHRFEARGSRPQVDKGRLGRDYLHVAIDDAYRLAYEILASEGKLDAIGLLERSQAWFGRLGVTLERVMTDNGSACRSKLFAAAMQQAGLRHVRTREMRPKWGVLT